VQLDPIRPLLKVPGTKRLTLNCDVLLSTSAFKFNLRRYIEDIDSLTLMEGAELLWERDELLWERDELLSSVGRGGRGARGAQGGRLGTGLAYQSPARRSTPPSVMSPQAANPGATQRQRLAAARVVRAASGSPAASPRTASGAGAGARARARARARAGARAQRGAGGGDDSDEDSLGPDACLRSAVAERAAGRAATVTPPGGVDGGDGKMSALVAQVLIAGVAAEMTMRRGGIEEHRSGISELRASNFAHSGEVVKEEEEEEEEQEDVQPPWPAVDISDSESDRERPDEPDTFMRSSGAERSWMGTLRFPNVGAAAAAAVREMSRDEEEDETPLPPPPPPLPPPPPRQLPPPPPPAPLLPHIPASANSPSLDTPASPDTSIDDSDEDLPGPSSFWRTASARSSVAAAAAAAAASVGRCRFTLSNPR